MESKVKIKKEEVKSGKSKKQKSEKGFRSKAAMTPKAVPLACCRMQAQGMPMHECTSARPEPLSLPMPGPCKAYHCDCTEHRPITGGGSADDPACHRGEVVYTGDHLVNRNHDERIPSGEENAPPSAGRRARCTLTNLAHALLLCVLPLRQFCHIVQCPKGNQLYY